MNVIIKYNDNIDFRRRAAFRRIYRGQRYKLRVSLEFVIMLICIIAISLMLTTAWGREMPVFVLYFAAVVAAYLVARFIRIFMTLRRVKPGDSARSAREFIFDETGFRFGPLDRDGTMIETKWRDIDRAYVEGHVIYLMCMARRHWAAIDGRLIVEGSWNDLLSLLRANLQGRKLIERK